MNKKAVYRYVVIGFISGFLLGLAGMNLEDYFHNVPVIEALSSFHHFIVPFLLGIISSIFGYILWKHTLIQNTEIHKYARNLHALVDINSALISTLELDAVLQIIIDESTNLTNLDTGAIYLHNDENLYLGATTPPLPAEFPEVLRHDLLVNHPIIKKTLTIRQPVVIPDTSVALLSEAELAVVKYRGLRSIIYIPLIVENRPVGTIILGTVNNLRDFTQQEKDIYQTFSGQAALAIENARLYKESQKIADELRQQNEEFYTLNEELSESNQRIYKINQELKEAKEKAEESDRLKTAFLNNISHEVRTPLNAITGFSNIITRADVPIENLKRFSNLITDSSNKLIDIITDIVEISQIQAQQIRLRNKGFDFIKLINKIAVKFFEKARMKNLEFKVNMVFPQNEYIVVLDAEKIEKLLGHLLDNAIKFTLQGSVLVYFELDYPKIKITITDTGIGISDEMQKIVFEPFRQVETGIVRNFGGNGLGLAIATAYVKLFNGTIALKSEINKGTTFYVEIPVGEQESKLLAEKDFVYDKKVTKILIAEDEYSNYQYLNEILKSANPEIIYASNGREALDLCRSNKSIDLVLMDIKMPIMDGHTAAKLIKDFRPELPIIAQTAYALQSEIDSYIGVFDDYITKPIAEETLKEKLGKYQIDF